MLCHSLPYSMSTNSKNSGETVLHLIFADHLNDKTVFLKDWFKYFFVILLPILSKNKRYSYCMSAQYRPTAHLIRVDRPWLCLRNDML